jgi:hypothetical protein
MNRVQAREARRHGDKGKGKGKDRRRRSYGMPERQVVLQLLHLNIFCFHLCSVPQMQPHTHTPSPKYNVRLGGSCCFRQCDVLLTRGHESEASVRVAPTSRKADQRSSGPSRSHVTCGYDVPGVTSSWTRVPMLGVVDRRRHRRRRCIKRDGVCLCL